MVIKRMRFPAQLLRPLMPAILAMVALSFGACSYDVKTVPEIAVEPSLQTGRPLPGRYGLVIGDSLQNLQKTVEGAGPGEALNKQRVCFGLVDFELDFRETAENSVRSTLSRLFAETQDLRTVPTRAQMQRDAMDRYAVVEFDYLQPRLVCERTGWFTSNCVSNSDAGLSLVVSNTVGEVFSTKVEAQGQAEGDPGMGCRYAPEVVAASVSKAFGTALGEMADRVRNAPALQR